MSETLLEYVDSQGAGLLVDREQGIVRGVKILGLASRNGRRYRADALQRAVPLYEGARVNVNHPTGQPTVVRDYRDRVGSIRNVSFRDAAGLYGDLHFNPKHALAEQLAWDAEHGGENVGLSHNVEARVERQRGETIVTDIVRVHSVDLVSAPATTEGLFEATGDHAAAAETPIGWSSVTCDELRRQRPDLVAQIQEQADPAPPVDEETERLRAALTRHERWRHGWQLTQAARARLAAHETALLDEALGETFWNSLADAPDDAAVERLVADRVRLVESLAHRERRAACATPCSAAQRLWDGGPREPLDAKAFADSIRRR